MNSRTWTIIGVIGVLAVCALCVGVLLLGAFFVGGGLFITNTVRSPVEANVEVSVEEQSTYEVEAPATLEITNQFGQIEVQAAEEETDTIQVKLTKTAYGVDQAEADRRLAELQVEVEETSNRVSLQVRDPSTERFFRQGSVDFTVTVPEETTVVLDSGSGRITLEGTSGKADLNTDFGEVRVNDFNGGLAVRTGSGQITVRRIDLLPDGNGDISLTTNFGEITLEDANTGWLEVDTGSGQVHLTNVQSSGDVRLDSEFGEIEWRTGSAAQLTVTAGSGRVQLSDLTVEGELQVETTFGEIRLTGVDAQGYRLTSGSGLITADLVRGRVIAQSRQNEVRITGGEEATVDLESGTGQLIYRGSLGDGPHSLETNFGDIQIGLPQDSAFDVDFQTNFGSIESAFEIEADGSFEDKHWTGSVNGGGAEIIASTQNGSISLEAIP